ncbi:MAG: hypothetical protein AAFZ15_10435 [Bacteroidota bacterium]
MSPNPVVDELNVEGELEKPEQLRFRIVNLQGEVVMSWEMSGSM